MKTATEVNAERIEAIIISNWLYSPQRIARAIIEAIPELQQQAQYTSERDGTSRTITTPLPWA